MKRSMKVLKELAKSDKKLPEKRSKAAPKTVAIEVKVAKQDGQIDWNFWHKPMVDSVLAFCFDEAVAIAERFHLRELDSEREPVTADTIKFTLFEVCEKLIELHLTGWKYKMGDERPLRSANIYRDDTSNLVAEIAFTQDSDDSDSHLFFEPKLVITLYTTGEGGPWFSIALQMVSQVF